MPERWDYRNREDVRDYDRDYGRERDRDRDYDRDYDRDRDRRGPIERAGDEVRSWFGDHEAARRRRLDEMRSERERSWSDRDRNPDERTWDRTRDTVRDVTDRDRDGRRGLSEWNDDDRPRSFGDASRYATADPYAPRPWTGTTYGEPVDRPYERDWDTPDYRGRGPRGYQRSDARVFEDICDRLTV